MEHFSTHPDVFFKLYEDASEKLVFYVWIK